MKILLVDADAASAHRLSAGLAAAGFGEPHLAETAAAAADFVNAEGGLDLLVTAVTLPDLDGFSLAEAMRAELPNLRVIFLAATAEENDADRAGGWPVLGAPADPAAVIAAILHLAPEADPLVGATLGGFRLEARLGQDADGPFYQAVQTAIGRPVEFHLLSPDRVGDAAEVERFLADARAKANVHHPALLSVFEAGAADGWSFYVSETRAGESLPELAARGVQLEPSTVLQILHGVSEAMIHLGQSKTPHPPLAPEHVIVDHRGHARLVNIAAHAAGPSAFREERRGLAEACSALTPADPSAAALHLLLQNMAADAMTVRSWAALIVEVKRCQEGRMPTPPVRLDPNDHSAIEAVAAIRRRSRRMRIALYVALGVLALGAAGFAWWYFRAERLGNPALEKMVAIPAGQFFFQGTTSRSLPAFWIDQHEVSIGQYADFLAWATRNPGTAALLRPEDTSPEHSLVPKGWAEMLAAARAGGDYEGMKLTLDSPVFHVDWPSAYAYALWKGRRLPTEEEWDRAAANAARAAGGEPAARGAAVNAEALDRTPEGVVGMAGGVSEWTQTVIETDGRRTPVVRGGNWSAAAPDVRARGAELDVGQSSPTVGFRTASSQPPAAP